MNPQPLFCPNDACPSRGVQGAGNIRVHDSLRDRWRCTTCQKTFSARQGTPFSGLKTDPKTVVCVLSLLAWGCPLQAIVHAFSLDERTVASWQNRAGRHCQKLHSALVTAHPMPLEQVQADEIRVKFQKRLVVWMAMALCVPTRLWLGGVVSPLRDKKLICTLAKQVKACACYGPILLMSDGLKSYVDAWRKAFRTSLPRKGNRTGRPHLLAWPSVVIAQMVKQYQQGRVVGIQQRLIQGTIEQLLELLPEVQKINTAYMERLNATFRARLCCLVRRGRGLARLPETLSGGMYLVGCLYNFCTLHASLSHTRARTPAMAAGLTDHCWSVGELLFYRIAPTPFVPPKRRWRRRSEVSETKGAPQIVTV